MGEHRSDGRKSGTAADVRRALDVPDAHGALHHQPIPDAEEGRPPAWRANGSRTSRFLGSTASYPPCSRSAPADPPTTVGRGPYVTSLRSAGPQFLARTYRRRCGVEQAVEELLETCCTCAPAACLFRMLSAAAQVYAQCSSSVISHQYRPRPGAAMPVERHDDGPRPSCPDISPAPGSS
jgi:hypothetical protein